MPNHLIIRSGNRSWFVGRRMQNRANHTAMQPRQAAITLQPVLERNARLEGESHLLRQLETMAYGFSSSATTNTQLADQRRLQRVLRALETGTLIAAADTRQQTTSGAGSSNNPSAKSNNSNSSSNNAQSAASSGGNSGTRPTETESATHWVEFRYLMAGTPLRLHDKEKYTLLYPTGQRETALLQNGIARREGIPTGTYTFQAPHFVGIKWEAAQAFHGEPVAFQVVTKNFPDNEIVEVAIYPAYQDEIVEPRATVQLKVQANQAWGSWEIEQALWESPRGSFVAVATWKSKQAKSLLLRLVPHPIESAKGIQQRLKRLGLYDDFIDGILGQHSTEATRQFQAAHPPLAVDGIAGPHTQFMLKTVLY